MRPLLLASASPRRRQLLALAGWAFDTCATDLDETPLPGELPEACVRRLSEAKARAAAQGRPDAALVIGSDTTVVLDGQILNKPADADEARRMLRQLRGRPHTVLTALTVLDLAAGQAHTELVASPVPMRAYSDAELDAYVATGDPLDKAGAYAIQHPDFQPVERGAFTHCFANVMGLPLCHLLRRLRQFGLDAPSLPAECQRFIPYECPVFKTILADQS